jgi:hypothetical protein
LVPWDGPHPTVKAVANGAALYQVASLAVPRACHSQRPRPVSSGQQRTTLQCTRPAPFPTLAGDDSARSGFASRGSE